MDDWKIKRDRAACERPGCPLPGQRHYYAVLEFPECLRRELCDACFAERESKAQREQAPLVFWRAARKQSGSKEPVLDLVSLRVLFDRLAEVDDDRARALRYFAALLLLRKRVLKVVPARTREQERADLVVRDPKLKDAEPIALFAPAIDLDDLGSIKEDLLAAIGEGEGDDARHDDARHDDARDDDARDGDDGAPADDAQGGDETDAGASGGDADQAGQADVDRAAERA